MLRATPVGLYVHVELLTYGIVAELCQGGLGRSQRQLDAFAANLG